ncbi:MAG: hypothetical protein JWO36_2008 [Myxococcales bacterium]|nr:hypothetical protein [Myxococcales bacterium]
MNAADSFLSTEERRHLMDEQRSARMHALARTALVLAQLEIEARIVMAEADLRAAEVGSGGPPRAPQKRGFLSWFSRRDIPSASQESDTLVKARRAQLERLRTVEGPEALKRAHQLAEALIAPLAEAETDGARPRPIVIERPATPTSAELPETPKPPHANGRPARSPIG